MLCLHVGGTMIECPLRRTEVSAYGRLKMQCFYVVGTMIECPFRRDVRLWEVKNAVFACGWEHD